VISKMLF